MHIKTVKVTNPNNVLVQIPGFVVSQWGVKLGDTLEVTYEDNELRINVQRGSDITGESEGVA